MICEGKMIFITSNAQFFFGRLPRAKWVFNIYDSFCHNGNKLVAAVWIFQNRNTFEMCRANSLGGKLELLKNEHLSCTLQADKTRRRASFYWWTRVGRLKYSYDCIMNERDLAMSRCGVWDLGYSWTVVGHCMPRQVLGAERADARWE